MTAPLIDGRWLRTPEPASGARVRGYNANPGYFFFLGFLTSFFGLLSLAMCDPPLQMDYNRCAQESEGRSRAGALEDAVGQVVKGILWVRRVGNPPLAPVDARTLWVARSLTSQCHSFFHYWQCCGSCGADPPVCAGRPRPASGTTGSASCRVRAGRRGRRPRSRGTAPRFMQAPSTGKTSGISLTSCPTSEHSLPGQGTGGPAPWALHLAPCLLRPSPRSRKYSGARGSL